MRILALVTGALLSAACGAPSEERGGFDFAMQLQPAVVDDTGELQIALLKNGSDHPCEEIVDRCLRENATVPASEFVRLFAEGDGAERRVLRVPIASGAPSGQEVTFLAEVGTNYRVVIEALSHDATPRLVGTSCTPLPGGVRQSGVTLPANPLVVYSPYLDCDPRIDP